MLNYSQPELLRLLLSSFENNIKRTGIRFVSFVASNQDGESANRSNEKQKEFGPRSFQLGSVHSELIRR